MIVVKPKIPFEFSHETLEVNKSGVYLVGVEFDGTACFRKGTRLGPQALRDISFGLESYSPYQDSDLEDYQNFFDLGNIHPGNSSDIAQTWHTSINNFTELFSNKNLSKIKILTIGGEHSISLAPIKLYLEYFSNLTLIHLDAHADLRDGFEGYPFSHASIMKRSLDHFKDEHELIQYGIRSGTKEEFQWMRNNDTRSLSLSNFLEKIESIDSKRPLYLTLDLDYFDPSILPGTGTPEAGGESFESFIKLIKILRKKNFVGADVVELSPQLDPSQNSSIFASKVVRELSLCLLKDLK